MTGAAHSLTAREIARQISAGETTAVAVAEATIERIQREDAELGAFLLTTGEEALAAAASVDDKLQRGEKLGPLAGVPIAVKDNLCTRGIPTTAGSKILEGWCPPYNATVIEKLHAAGMVLVGKTNLDEFAMGSSTENSAYQLTRNPHDASRVPGGSSGGSAAAVAAGLVSCSLGSDTGGSIRQPASFCGVVGVKPTYGRTSRFGLIAYASSFDQIGPFGRDVTDAALLLEAIEGHDTLDSTSLPEAGGALVAGLHDGVAGLRIGIVSELMGEGIEPAVAARIRAAAEAFAAAGAEIVEVSIPAVSYAISAYYILAPAEASSNLSRFDGVRFGLRVDAPTTPEMYELTRTQGFGAEVKRRIMLGTYALSAGYYDAYYGTAQKVRTLLRADFEAAYRQADLLISPVAPTTAFPIGELTEDPLTMYLQDICTIPTNLAGHPAMSVPFGSDGTGLPVGVQILAPALREDVMFRAAMVLESALQQGSNPTQEGANS
ncbi:MAG TPA: Asp-tRNA(Asn)/Glu-tRNA(Gln) amidotransferase GatCAB subunit A [Acidimicrobiaceae bacterium]|nr:Asp-tRNA(Asn)/Glu-tRNA(Gln) amidotransferase GatCAB subunit A [Acidimicrobiaceae bacterium]